MNEQPDPVATMPCHDDKLECQRQAGIAQWQPSRKMPYSEDLPATVMLFKHQFALFAEAANKTVPSWMAGQCGRAKAWLPSLVGTAWLTDE